jgi:hypothetical protein
MDDQARFNLEIEDRGPLAKDSRKRLEALLKKNSNNSEVPSQPSTQDPIAAAAKRFGVTPKELAEDAEKMGF